METYFNGCEDPDFVDLEMEMPADDFGMLPGEELLPEAGLDLSELEELGGLQEEFETAILDDASLVELMEFGPDVDEFPILEEPEPVQMDESVAITLENIIMTMKKYPGLKITFSF